VPEIQPWDGNYEHPPNNGGQESLPPIALPPLPGDLPAGPDGVQVETRSLTDFADLVERLNLMITAAYDRLASVRPVQPGAFGQANDVRTKVNGENGLVAGHMNVLNDLNNGFVELRDGMRGLALRYQNVEDANSITAETFDNAVVDAGPLFTRANDDS
jgi:hypothetical protein